MLAASAFVAASIGAGCGKPSGGGKRSAAARGLADYWPILLLFASKRFTLYFRPGLFSTIRTPTCGRSLARRCGRGDEQTPVFVLAAQGEKPCLGRFNHVTNAEVSIACPGR